MCSHKSPEVKSLHWGKREKNSSQLGAEHLSSSVGVCSYSVCQHIHLYTMFIKHSHIEQCCVKENVLYKMLVGGKL